MSCCVRALFLSRSRPCLCRCSFPPACCLYGVPRRACLPELLSARRGPAPDRAARSGNRVRAAVVACRRVQTTPKQGGLRRSARSGAAGDDRPGFGRRPHPADPPPGRCRRGRGYRAAKTAAAGRARPAPPLIAALSATPHRPGSSSRSRLRSSKGPRKILERYIWHRRCRRQGQGKGRGGG